MYYAQINLHTFCHSDLTNPCKVAELEIAVGHFPTNLPHLAEQIQFARPNVLYISNGEAIDSLLQYSCF